MKSISKNLATFAIGGLCAVVAGAVSAGSLILEGSDATGAHGSQAGGPVYTTQLFTFMKGASLLPVAVFGSAGETPSAPAGTVFLTDLTTFSAANYSGLYIQSPGGCCDQNLSGASAYGSQIGAFYAAGGSVAIMDYQGGNWSFLSPLLIAPPPGTIKGYNTGGGGPSCTDGEVFTADALAKGFTQPPSLGCWEHQAFDMNYFAPLGFISLVNADIAYFGTTASGAPRGSALAVLGGPLGEVGCTNPLGCDTPTPVPGTVPLLAIALIGLWRQRITRK
jgi:hypothetical protein